MTGSRLARLAAGAVLVGAIGLATTVPAAGQEDPFAPDAGDSTTEAIGPSLLQYGWWNKAQQSPAGGSPTPAPPGAPSDGIFVLYGPSGTPPAAAVTGPLGAVPPPPDPADVRPLGPEAFGAVRFAVPLGVEATLTLRYTPTTTTQPGSVNPDVGDLFACPVESAWDPVQNGRYDSAPKYACGNGVQGVIAGDTVTFALPAALDVDGVFDVALVPMGTRPYRVAFQPPSDASLVLTSQPETVAGEEAFDSGTFEDPAAAYEETPFDEGVTTFDTGGDLTGGAFDPGAEGSFDVGTSAPGTNNRPATPGRRRGAVATPVATVNPFAPDAGRGERLMAVALLALLAGGLWWLGGQPVRAPRLLGSVGGVTTGGGPTAVVVTDDLRRGIGRFARVRTDSRPPRLF